jgi:hypothetical protein
LGWAEDRISSRQGAKNAKFGIVRPRQVGAVLGHARSLSGGLLFRSRQIFVSEFL